MRSSISQRCLAWVLELFSPLSSTNSLHRFFKVAAEMPQGDGENPDMGA
jgi:hypothetical protein